MIYKGYIIDIYPVKGSYNKFYHARIRKPIFNKRVPWLTNRKSTLFGVSTKIMYHEPLKEAKLFVDKDIEKSKNIINYNMFKNH